MKKILYVLLIVLTFSAYKSPADDIEIVVKDIGGEGVPYLHVILDSSPTAFNTLCIYGPSGSCAPPFMSQAAYGNLLSGHSSGDSVSRFEVFGAILATLFQDPQFEKLYVSLFTSQPNAGGKILAGYRQLGRDYGGISGFQSLMAILKTASIQASLNAPHHFQAKEASYHWYRYLNGGIPEGEIPPITLPEACPKFFSIVMATESSVEDDTLANEIRQELGLPLSGGLGFVDLLKKMHSDSTDLIKDRLAGNNSLEKTWIVASSSGVDLAKAWAKPGKTGVPMNLDEPAQLEKRLYTAFQQTLSLSRANVTRGVPMTAFGHAAGDIYTPLYSPARTIRWSGNLKKFKLGRPSEAKSGDPGEIVDARGKRAVESSGDDAGQIVLDALSFWTDVTSLPHSLSAEFPIGVDGRVVARGGAGQKIPGFVTNQSAIIGDRNEEAKARQLWYEPSSILNGTTNKLPAFNADGTGEDSTAAQLLTLLGATTVSEAETLIRWGRGQDVDDEDGDGLVGEPRSWIMGSAIHSRPLALNYGAVAGHTTSNPNIRIFVGTNDGVFHGIENTSTAGKESGREVFGFYPAEALGNVALLRQDSISSLEMRYGVDGSPVAFTVDNNGDGNLNHEYPDNDEAYVYFGMRRGGTGYYALDVSDPAAAPSLRWKISRTPAGGDFSELGLSFSKPIVGRVKFGEQAIDVLIFAGGYNGGWNEAYEHRVGKDLNADDDVSADGRVSIGNAIYIVDARSGELVWKAVYGAITSTAVTSTNTRFEHAGLVDSIPSSVSALKASSGVIHRLYLGDTGGAVWRVDLPVSNDGLNADHRRERWFVSKLAALGTDGTSTDRRFFHAPDLVRSKQDDATPFDGVLISSGNRASPNDTEVVNYHFYIKDYLTVSGDDTVRSRPVITISETAEESGLPDRTACLRGGTGDTDFNCTLSTDSGWMIKLTQPGEKGLSSPLVDGGKVFFSSYVPAIPMTCTAQAGEGYLYLVNLRDGSSVTPGQRIYPVGSGIPAGTITLNDQLLTPLGGIGELERGACTGKLCRRYSTSLHKIYWREPGVDEF